MADESLLDVFVTIGVKEEGETVAQYVERAKTEFSKLKQSSISSFEKQTAALTKDLQSKTRAAWKSFIADQDSVNESLQKQADKRISEKVKQLEKERKLDEQAEKQRITSLRKAITSRLKEEQRIEEILQKEEDARLAEKIRVLQEERKLDEQAEKQRIESLRKAITSRLKEQQRIESELRKQKEAEIAERQRLLQEELKLDEQAEKQRIESLRKAITSRLKEQQKAENALKKEQERAAKDAQAEISGGLREALLKFGQEKDLLSIQVRLLGDDDISRRLQDIQSRVSAATKTFNLAEPGEAGDPQRQSSIAQINALREQELATLREITNEQIKQRGLESVYENQADAFLKATQNAQSFNQQLKELNRLVSSTKDTPLISEFSKLKTEIERAQLALRQGLASGNLVDIDDATAQLNTLRLQFDRFRDDAEKAIVIRTNAQQISANFDEMLARLKREETRDASLTRGNALSGDQRVALAELKQEVSEITFEFRKLSSQTDLTAKDIQDLAVLFDRLKTARTNIGDIRQEVIATGPQLNTLSNNAYQLGQAFEDAAIGFELNGIAGAFRGAANNVSFLIQNITQAAAATQTITKRTADLISLYTGVGAAVGFLVLPPLIEWLQTLNDIELKSKDISDLLRDEFSDAAFEVRLILDQREALRAIQDAEDAIGAIEQLIKQAQEAGDLELDLRLQLENISGRQVIQDLNATLDDVQAAIAQRRSELKDEVVFTDLIGGQLVIPGDRDEIKKIDNLNSALSVLREGISQTFERSAKGLDIGNSLEAASDAASEILRLNEELLKSGSINADQAKNYENSVRAAKEELEKLSEKQKELQAISESVFGPALDKAAERAKELSDEFEFQRAVNEGRLSESDRFLFNLVQQTKEIEAQSHKIRELFGNDPRAAKLNELTEENLRREQGIEIDRERLDIQEEIDKARRDSAKDAERSAERQRDIEKRIAEERIRGNERVARAEEALNDELDAQQLSATEDRIQKRIEALQKAETQSRNFQLGDVGTIAFGPDTKTEVERLQQQLKDLRESAGKAADEERIRELNERIRSEREESQNRIQDLRDDLAEARQEEIDALNDNAEEINKLIEQLKLLEGALQQIQNGGPLGIPELGPGGERNGPMFLPEGDIEAIGNAQANANAAAMQNVDFKSSSIETLIGQSNRLLSSMNATLQNQDLQPRLV